MKILHVIPAIAPRYGGPSRAIFGLCRALLDSVDVQIVSTNADGPGCLPLPVGVPVEFEGVPTIAFNRAGPEGLKYSAGLARWLAEHVADFDLVHIHAPFSHACISAARSARRANRPWIIRPLGTLDSWSIRHRGLRKLLFLNVALKPLLLRASAIHYTSRLEADQTEEWLKSGNGVVIPNGIDERAFLSASEHAAMNRDPFILFLGRIDPKKGIETLIDAFRAWTVSAPASAWRLVVAGDGEVEYVDELRRRGAGLPIDWTGWLDFEEKYRVLRKASLFALPSRNENFGIAVAEALALGTPVMLSDAVGLAEAVERCGGGWVVRADDSWPVALRSALESPEELSARGARAQQLAQEFRWSKVASSVIELYERILEGGGRGHAN